MSSPLTDPEQWYAAYEAASAKQQYEMLLEAIAQPLSLELAEELDLGMLLVEMRDALVTNNLLEQATGLIHTLQRQQPELYQQEFPFLDNLLVEYYLYRDQPEQVRAALERFRDNPVDDIDQTLALLDDLQLYDAADLAVEFCRATYQPVARSPKVLPGVEMDLSTVVLSAMLQQAYEQIQTNQSVDWEQFLAEAVEFGYDDEPAWVDELRQNLNLTVEANPEFFTDFKRDRSKVIRALSIEFLRYMKDQKQVSFVCANAIWGAVFDFLESRKLPRKQLAHPDSYFNFSKKALDEYAGQKIGGFLSMQRSVGFALLWGIPYVYELLHAKQIIGEAGYQQAIDITTELKTELIDAFPQLWKYDFVHRWLPPESVSASELEAEAQRFAASLEQVAPLSEEPGQGVEQSLLGGLSKLLPPELLKEMEDEEFATALAEAEEDDDLPLPPQSKTPSLKPIKPPKSRKSPLRLAAELTPDPKKPSNKSKKKK